ncbi:hypothetical protein [Yersinia phage fHe-Yen9-04]|uniref:Uncharacterized protein n=2 Tax=Eneladusvirus Yen904 TaxID=2560849 RepID=A0A2C9CXH3_9CAUD|nr:hypothetical protein FDJ41_gp466 [Yersinia phage fHe-Yen9-04]SOK58714.1 hypothetical protein [Yersinia phage fHe-Yen9-04]SOK59249.1 hypothetical protein [Yersinia phage fHe-Yen9-03]VUE36483.1 hypothetical protein [Yersinia phage fHe-Yen9-04]
MFLDEIKHVPFPSYKSLEKARTESSKSINPTTYDRYKKYHYPVGTEFRLAKAIDSLIVKIKKVIKYVS